MKGPPCLPTNQQDATGAARRSDDRGEGVISAAIVVLIMALIGAAMWVTFDGLWNDVSTRTEEQVDRIGGG